MKIVLPRLLRGNTHISNMWLGIDNNPSSHRYVGPVVSAIAANRWLHSIKIRGSCDVSLRWHAGSKTNNDDVCGYSLTQGPEGRFLLSRPCCD